MVSFIYTTGHNNSVRKNTMNYLIKIAVILFFHLYSSIKTSAQLPKAAAPVVAPATALNVTKVLEKAGQFTTMIRILKATQVAAQMDGQLKNSNTGMTLFAPTDNAFNSLPAGALNSITDQQKVELMQYHVLPKFVSATQFMTLSNPVRTQAADRSGQFPLNVITSGNNHVNISTGVVNATISNTLFTNGKLAVYQVDQVLLPQEIFGKSDAPAPSPTSILAPAPSKPVKEIGVSPSNDNGSSIDAPTGSASEDSSDDVAAAANSLDLKACMLFLFFFLFI
ncbi:Fasciclin-like arabinogalactan protein 11 [Zostera marina]|uniref:Fasciclin-like arabinogalactan protein 11 n=1 Tax=Zostera marina TaxID=29655 RepID=A0A0K9P3U4_ZOSMR|nr:Fasciclin-like arabinogalactan protein 11 [Zostera marina]